MPEASIAKLNRKVEQFMTTRETQDKLVDQRFQRIEDSLSHQDTCMDEMKEKFDRMTEAMLLFYDPKAWLQRNWLVILIVGGGFTAVGGGSLGAIFKLLSGIFS